MLLMVNYSVNMAKMNCSKIAVQKVGRLPLEELAIKR